MKENYIWKGERKDKTLAQDLWLHAKAIEYEISDAREGTYDTSWSAERSVRTISLRSFGWPGCVVGIQDLDIRATRKLDRRGNEGRVGWEHSSVGASLMVASSNLEKWCSAVPMRAKWWADFRKCWRMKLWQQKVSLPKTRNRQVQSLEAASKRKLLAVDWTWLFLVRGFERRDDTLRNTVEKQQRHWWTASGPNLHGFTRLHDSLPLKFTVGPHESWISWLGRKSGELLWWSSIPASRNWPLRWRWRHCLWEISNQIEELRNNHGKHHRRTSKPLCGPKESKWRYTWLTSLTLAIQSSWKTFSCSWIGL